MGREAALGGDCPCFSIACQPLIDIWSIGITSNPASRATGRASCDALRGGMERGHFDAECRE
jgi:hypothetical protein